MNPLLASGVFRQYGDSRFYKTPCLKSMLVGASACSIVYRLLSVRATSPRWLLWGVSMWACPSAGVWLVAVLIFISCRPLERQLGAAKLACHLFSSVVGGLALAASLYVGSSYHDNTLPLPTGALLHVIVGSLTWLYHVTVYPLHTIPLLPSLPITTSTILYLLSALFSCSSPEAGSLALCGVVGAGVQSVLGPLPLPSPPSWVTSCVSFLLDSEGQPPPMLSGATLEVQREQQMDQLEEMMTSIRHNRLRARVALHDRLRRPQPSQEQISQLVAMGFNEHEARQALVATGNDTAGAIHLLMSRNFPS